LEYAVSPNRAWLACRLASGKLEFLDIAESGRFRQALRTSDGATVVNVIAHTLIGALLNNRDHADAENIVRRASRLKEGEYNIRIMGIQNICDEECSTYVLFSRFCGTGVDGNVQSY